MSLLGSGGPSNPAARDITLYVSRADLESWTPAFRAALHAAPGVARTWEFEFPEVTPGSYFVRACFEFGCGEYREPGTGELRRVTVRGGQVTPLPFGI